MEFKKANTVLLSTVISLLIIAILVLLKIILSNNKSLDLGNLSDRVSAACNIVMAGAAIFAAYSAKKWFKQRTHTVGFEKAEALISLIDNHFRWIAVNRIQMIFLSGYLDAVEDGLTQIDGDIEINYFELKRNYEEKKEEIRIIFHQFELLERWNLNSSYKALINSTLENMELHLTEMVISFQFTTYYIEYSREQDKRFMLMREKINEYMSNASFAYQRLETDYDKFKRIKFDDLFKVS